MVAREESSKSGYRGARDKLVAVLRAWFLTWRLLLTKALRLPVAWVRGLSYHPRPGLMLSFLRSPEKTVATETDAPTRLAALGVRAFAAGALVMALVAVWTGTDTVLAFTRVATAVAWALARLAIMLFLARKDPTERAAVATGWAIGMLPYVLGATAGLRVTAFFVSAIYTDAALCGVGLKREDAHALVTRAFGAQAIVVSASWAFRGLTALVVVLGTSF